MTNNVDVDEHNMVLMVLSHFSKSISQTTSFWELGLGLFGIRVVLRGKSGIYEFMAV